MCPQCLGMFPFLMSTEIKRYSVRDVSCSFIWGLTEDDSPEAASEIALRDCSKEVKGGGQNICVIGERVRAVKHTSQ